MWREQAMIDWSRRVISIVACCHSAKLCAHTAWDFRSQQTGAVARMWKVVPGAASTKRMCDQCCSLQKGGDVVATSPLALRWLCDSPRMGCAQRITPIHMWREQTIIQWSHRVISIVACCHSAKLCAHAAIDFRSQHLKLILIECHLIDKVAFKSVTKQLDQCCCLIWY